MKFERERDIEAFKGKNWREKWVLHNQAQQLDPWILRLRLLIYCFVFVPIFIVSFLLASQFFQSAFWTTIAINLLVGLPIDTALHSLLILPRIRKALDTSAQAIA
jgi:hypothetical protein